MSQRCIAHNRRGQRCNRTATAGSEYCTVHDPASPQDMSTLGRKGGQEKTRQFYGISDEVADEGLLTAARERLWQLVHSDNEQIAVRASTALHSYRSATPPAEVELEAPEYPRMSDGSRAISLGDVLQWAYECGGSTAAVADDWIRQGLQARRAHRRNNK